jgi:hypothetical protein
LRARFEGGIAIAVIEEIEDERCPSPLMLEGRV